MQSKWQGIKTVTVVGLGITGLSVVRHLCSLPFELDIRVMDTRVSPPQEDKLPTSVQWHKGSWQEEWLQDSDLVVVNPGIALATPQIQRLIQQGTTVVGDIELFAWSVDKPVVAITGSNGKSTVTDMMGVVANACGVKTLIGGNIGVPALDLLELDADLYVLELSSFQLETTHTLKLMAAAFLNLSEDHMDRYSGMDDYREAKLRIFDNAQSAIVNQDDSATYPTDQVNGIVSFSLTGKGNFTLKGKEVCYRESVTQALLPVGLSTDSLQMVGLHNVANVMAVLALLKSVNIDFTLAIETIQKYSGLQHRCQLIAESNGVRWVNDSKATNVASTIAALSGLDLPGCLYLLVGGEGKGADFSELKPILTSMNVHLCCYGVDGDQFLSLHSSTERFGSIDDIITAILPRLNTGDMVMLSPACASFDQFSSFIARGEYFTQLVNSAIVSKV
ncbi:UDP-N-acetylmuramoyl-L-alanine--D-glutamate ligase [Vibrio sp.]|nr:UDP-N-acetylmuramoyl-L-alanine--D-glutamate ligase [Vibrio sp.]